jgi:hypothetical protein
MVWKVSDVSGHLYRDPGTLPQDKESWIQLIKDDHRISEEKKEENIKRLNNPAYWEWFSTLL